MQGSVGYNLGFAAAVCLVCAVVVSTADPLAQGCLAASPRI